MEQNSCGALLKQIHDAMERRANYAMREQDLTMAQTGALLILNGRAEKEASLKELERELHVAQSTAAGIVSRLEKKGFVISFSDAVDKRVKIVRITEQGELCCQNAYRDMLQAENQLLSGLTETERVIFCTLLKKVRDTLK